MAGTLYLTAEEQQKFATLPSALTKGWDVQPEVVFFKDNQKQLSARAKSVKFKSSALVDFQNKCKTLKNEQEILSLAQSLDLSDVSEADMIDLMFVIGPEGLTVNIGMLFVDASTEKIGQIEALSLARHSLLSTLPTKK